MHLTQTLHCLKVRHIWGFHNKRVGEFEEDLRVTVLWIFCLFCTSKHLKRTKVFQQPNTVTCLSSGKISERFDLLETAARAFRCAFSCLHYVHDNASANHKMCCKVFEKNNKQKVHIQPCDTHSHKELQIVSFQNKYYDGSPFAITNEITSYIRLVTICILLFRHRAGYSLGETGNILP